MHERLDAVFVHGEHLRQQFLGWLPAPDIQVTGYPQFSPFLRGEIDRDRVARGFGLNPRRTTVVYCSTWAADSPLERFADALVTLGRAHKVIYKPHHRSLTLEPERYEVLRRSSRVLVVETEPDIVPFLAVADLVVADVRSGSLTEALLVDRPAIGLSADRSRDEPELLDDLAEAVPICSEPAELERLVDEVLGGDRWAAGRERLKRRLFTDFGGRDDEVTAEAMIEVIHRKRSALLAGAGA